MEPQFENRILPFHFGINPLATYAPMEYFAHHLERTEREVIWTHFGERSRIYTLLNYLNPAFSRFSRIQTLKLTAQSYLRYITRKIMLNLHPRHLQVWQNRLELPSMVKRIRVMFAEKHYLLPLRIMFIWKNTVTTNRITARCAMSVFVVNRI